MSTIGNPKSRSVFRCTACAESSPKWVGRCPGCQEWNTLVEEAKSAPRARVLAPSSIAVPITDVPTDATHPMSTGVGEVDRVLGGGLVPGSVTLIGGEPGVGKSTLLLQLLAGLAKGGAKCLYVSAEESAQQVRRRAERLDALVPSILLAAETSLPQIMGHIEAVRPAVVVVDSVQAVFDPELSSAAGSVTQVRECAHRLVTIAKERDIAVVLVGHVTKEGALAGPRVLEHVVDTVLAFDGDRHHSLRLLRAVKHRYGSTQELGLFAMGETGLDPVDDPSHMFLADRRAGVAGSVVVPTLEGRRPLLIELQALVSPTSAPQPRRSAQGLDSGRVGMLIAVIAQRLELPMAGFDVFTLAVGGARVPEPAADLGVALAILSSISGVPIPSGVTACGEVGLGGELRSVTGIERRLAEAARLGFDTALVPASTPEFNVGLTVERVSTLLDAVERLDLDPRR